MPPVYQNQNVGFERRHIANPLELRGFPFISAFEYMVYNMEGG